MFGEMMRSLRRSIGCKGRAFVCNNRNRSIISSTYSCNLSSSSFDASRSAPFLHFSRCNHAMAEKGSSSILKTVVSYGKEVLKKLVNEPRGLKEGDTVDLSNLLLTKDRDYLIKCNGGQVKVEQMAGKVVVIYFDSILKMDSQCLNSLKHMYNDLQTENNFEVVFVDTNEFDADRIFEIHAIFGMPSINIFPTLPWTAIPLSDVPSRKHLIQTFDIQHQRAFVVINSASTILHWSGLDIICRYGPAGFPFTNKRIDELKSEDAEDVRNPSLNALLASGERDYLVSNTGKEVSIHTLEDKVVALFFYSESDEHRDFTAELKVAYEELRVKNKDFEVVLIYVYDSLMTNNCTSEETFSNTFKTMPWLALPFGDSRYYKLKRLFFIQWDMEMLDYGLIVIGPRMKFIQPFGMSILKEFKSPAYPFTCERVAELVTKEAKELELKMLWNPDSVFGGLYTSQVVELRTFVNKKVIVLYDCYGSLGPGFKKEVGTLKERYESMDTNDEFEVIHITTEANRRVYHMKLPWVVVQLDRDYKDEPNFFGLRGTFRRIPSLVAFDRDGKIVRKTMFPTFDETRFPFFSGSMEKEALSQLFEVFEWDEFEDYVGTIYTSKKICSRSM